jgi:hypothetical protein
MQENVMKYCSKCKKTKPKVEFAKHKKNNDGLQYWCKPCKRENTNKNYCKTTTLNKYRERTYGVTPEQWELMSKRCGDACEICGGDNGDVALCIDHNHETGEVRGLLCHKCNQGMGLLGDSEERLLKAATYLKERGQYGV